MCAQSRGDEGFFFSFFILNHVVFVLTIQGQTCVCSYTSYDILKNPREANKQRPPNKGNLSPNLVTKQSPVGTVKSRNPTSKIQPLLIYTKGNNRHNSKREKKVHNRVVENQYIRKQISEQRKEGTRWTSIGQSDPRQRTGWGTWQAVANCGGQGIRQSRGRRSPLCLSNRDK